MKILPKKNYLDYIQLLRGLSVLLVFLFHTDLNFFSNGFLGVDVFFVISGYVITKILKERFFYNRKYFFKEFYIRRILRIVPIYFFVVISFSIIFILIGPLTDIDYIIKKIIFIFTFTSNFYYLNFQKEYFDNIFQDPLNHTWSVAVEMQFYLFFPFLIYFLRKNFKEESIIKILLGIIITGIFITYYFSKNINLTFYSPIFRSWEFLLGSLVYYLHNKKNFDKSSVVIKLNKIYWPFIIVVIVTIFFTKPEQKFYSILLTTICASFFLLLRKKISKQKLNNTLVLYLGNISYSFYLYHLPVLFFFNIYFETKLRFIFAFIITIILSHFSYIYVENKFRNNKINISKQFIFLTTLITILLLGLIKTYSPKIKTLIIENNYLEQKYFLTKRINYTEIKINNNQIISHCASESKIYHLKFNSLRSDCLKFTNNKTLIFVEGDSHTVMLMPIILSSTQFENIYYINNSNYSYKEVNDQLKYFKKVVYVKSINNVAELDAFNKNLENFENDINFLIFTPVPNYYNDKIRPVECLIQNKNCLFNSEEDYKNRSISDFNRKIIEIKKNSVNKNILYFDPYKILCPSKICYVYNVKNKILIYRDGNHLTIEGSLLLKKQFNKFLKKNLDFFE